MSINSIAAPGRARRGRSFSLMLLLGSAFVATPAFAQGQPAPAAADEDANITVTGRRVSAAAETIGENKVTNTVGITREALLSAPSGISGLKMLETLPGFNVQTDGALGLYEFGNSVQTRAFNLDQIGFLIDGIPTGRSDVFGGSPIFRYVDNENLASVEASVGAGDVGLPSYSSLGPIVQYKTIAPQEQLGLFVSQSFGDNDLRRTFIRANSGRVGPFTAYVSRTKLKSDLWRGAGSVDREHWEAQIHADLGGSSWARLKFVSNDFFDYDSPSLTQAQYLSATPDLGGATGRDRGYIVAPSPTTAGFTPTVAGVPYSNSNYTYSYNLSINVRKDKLYGGTVHLGIADGIWAETTAYWEDKGGYGVSPDSYSNSLGIYNGEKAVGLPVVAPRGTQFGRSGVGGNRYGIVSKLHIETGINTFEAGIWAEEEKYHRTQARYNTVDGSPSSAPNLNELVFLRRDYRSQRDTTQIFVKDNLKLLDDKLIIDLGVKSLNLDYVQTGYRDYADYYRNIGTSSAPIFVAGYGPKRNSAHYNPKFLPLAGLLYKLDGQTQLFGSYAKNYALPKGLDDIYSVTLASSSGVVPEPKAEKSQNFEIGVRTNQHQFYAALAGYYTKFANRIQSITSILPGTLSSTETFYQNVGRVKAYGLEFTGSYKPAFLNGLAYANTNITYNIAKFRDDIVGTPSYATAGKYIPDSAKWIVSGGVTIEPASWLVANVSGKYVSKRYSTFTNLKPNPDTTSAITQVSSAIPGYTVFSAYVDIGDGITLGPVKGIKARINVDNIFDKDVLSFISPTIAGGAANGTGATTFRPLSPRTFQFTITGEI